MSELILDIETIPDATLLADLKPSCKLGNLKDPKKIEDKLAEWDGSEGQVKAMSVSPSMCKIVSI